MLFSSRLGWSFLGSGHLELGALEAELGKYGVEHEADNKSGHGRAGNNSLLETHKPGIMANRSGAPATKPTNQEIHPARFKTGTRSQATSYRRVRNRPPWHPQNRPEGTHRSVQTRRPHFRPIR